jgi:hypothetical protein
MVIVDSDVFLIEHRFPRDKRAEINATFLVAVRTAAPALTIFNLMEILGILSFNLSSAKLAAWREWLKERYSLAILWPEMNYGAEQGFFEQLIFHQPLGRMMAQPIPFLDALVLAVAERTPDVCAFVTWNARHFAGKTHLPVMTPAEYLSQT